MREGRGGSWLVLAGKGRSWMRRRLQRKETENKGSRTRAGGRECKRGRASKRGRRSGAVVWSPMSRKSSSPSPPSIHSAPPPPPEQSSPQHRKVKHRTEGWTWCQWQTSFTHSTQRPRKTAAGFAAAAAAAEIIHDREMIDRANGVHSVLVNSLGSVKQTKIAVNKIPVFQQAEPITIK